MTLRRLIVNADDFGLSEGVNRGIVTAHENGLVTSASLMVRQPAAAEAAEYARSHPALGVGLHIDLGEWAFRDGGWVSLYRVVPVDDAEAVRAEVGRQLAAFRDLVGRGPTHLDSHQHTHTREPVLSVVVELGRQLGVPVRHFTPGVRYCGDFYGQDGEGNSYPDLVTAEALVRLLGGLSPGVAELCCHPGFDDNLDTMYVRERAAEVEALCAPEARSAVDRLGIALVTFREFAGEGVRP
jgi:predicted glycoside hydrolase/deacetylase ChbG (UPF0249 family)